MTWTYCGTTVQATIQITVSGYGDNDTPPTCWVISYSPPSLQSGPVTIRLGFEDVISGMDYSVNPDVSLMLSDETELTVTGAYDTDENDNYTGTWTGTVTIPADSASGVAEIWTEGATDNDDESMPLTDVGPGPDIEPVPAPTASNLPTGGYFVSPCYFKGTKSAEAVDVLWRYYGEDDNSWRSVWDDVENHTYSYDSVMGDTWWATPIPLDISPKNANLTNSDRTVYIEIACVDSNYNISDITPVTLTWALTPLGGPHHLIMDEKMILSGPADGGASITVEGPKQGNVLTGTYSSPTQNWNGVPNWVVPFSDEGHKTFTGTVTGGSLGQSDVQSVTIHVIAHREVEAIGWWYGDNLPTSAWDWTTIGVHLALTDPGWEDLNIPAEADYLLYLNPTPDTYTEWAGLVYSIQNGHQATPPNDSWASSDCPLLWWSPQLTSEYTKIQFYAKYTEPGSGATLTNEWDVADVSGVAIDPYSNDEISAHKLYGTGVLPGGPCALETPEEQMSAAAWEKPANKWLFGCAIQMGSSSFDTAMALASIVPIGEAANAVVDVTIDGLKSVASKQKMVEIGGDACEAFQRAAQHVLKKGAITELDEAEAGGEGALAWIDTSAKEYKNATGGRCTSYFGSGPAYANIGWQTHSPHLCLPPDWYQVLVKNDKWWPINKKFIDQALARGDLIRIVMPTGKTWTKDSIEAWMADPALNHGSWLVREYDYLYGLGYRLSRTGQYMIK